MTESQQDKSFRLVFDGRLVPGRSATEVEADFARRFGEAAAKNIFSGKSVTLNRNLSREDAQKRQRIFKQLGIIVQAVPTAPAVTELSLVDAPLQPAEEEKAEPNKPDKADFGTMPDRSPARPVKARVTDVYSMTELAEAFGDSAEIPVASRGYLMKLIPVTALMLLLPLIYISITLLSGVATFWVAVEGLSWFADNPGYLRLIGFTAGLLGALLLTIFLLRPLVASTDHGPQPVRLDPAREPILFDLVERVTDAVGAPMPEEILVDSDANASARLTHGAFSKGLTLTIGMPLLYGLDLQSLTGVLAHEFGHFTQRVGMRSSSLVHQINYWFHRQIHERDNWDRFVEGWLETDNVILTLAAALAQLGSFLVRLLLHLLSMLAALFSFSLSREMEYDADRYEISLVGSNAYEKTANAMRTLGAGHQMAVADVSMAFDSDRKVDNLPKLAAQKSANFTDKEQQAMMADIDEVNSSMFDTHPSDKARIRKAKEMDMPARFVHTGPASKLLREPDRLSRLVTLQWYRSFGVDVGPDDLIPLESFASETGLLKDADDSISEYLGELDCTPYYLPLVSPGALAKLDEPGLIAGIEEAQEQLSQGKTDFLLLRKKMEEDIEYQAYYRQALFWRRADFNIDLNAYRLPLTTTDVSEISKKLVDYKASENTSRSAFRPCIELQGRRLSFELELAVRRGAAERDEIEKLRRAYSAMAATEDDVSKLQNCGDQIDLLLQILETLPDEVKYQRQLKSDTTTNLQLQRLIRTSLGTVADPFSERTPLADVLPNEYEGVVEQGPAGALDDAARVIRSVGRTSYKLLGRMSGIALEAERHVYDHQAQARPDG